MYCIQIFAYVVGVIIHNQNFDKNFQKPNIPDKILAANSCWVWPEDLGFIGSTFIAMSWPPVHTPVTLAKTELLYQKNAEA